MAKETKELTSWKKPTPIFKQEFDWLKLTSDEWLKGDIIAMYSEKLEFDSDEMGMQKIKLKDIAELRSKDILSIRLSNGSIYEGRLLIIDGELSLVNNGHAQNFSLDHLVSIASSEENERNLWDGSVNAGVNFREGNTKQLDYSFGLSVQRRTSTSRLKADFVSNFSRNENQDTKKEEETANSKRLTAFYDWFFSQNMFFRAANFEYFSDEFQNVDYRLTLGSALGYHLIDSKRATWDVTAGPSYQYTSFSHVEDGDENSADSAVLTLASYFEYEITNDIDFELNYQVQVVSEDAGSFIHYLESSLEVELVNDFELKVTLFVDRTDKPHPDEFGLVPEKNDYRLVVGLNYDF